MKEILLLIPEDVVIVGLQPLLVVWTCRKLHYLFPTCSHDSMAMPSGVDKMSVHNFRRYLTVSGVEKITLPVVYPGLEARSCGNTVLLSSYSHHSAKVFF
jgi:hypothetical protein